jgi:hypothetical protein
MEYDVIGDIHGKGSLLEALLARLGYARRSKAWVPPLGRQAVFLGDLIDRGEEQLKVLDIVRRMSDNGHARCIMGNHELNAIGWATPSAADDGSFLRPHTAGKRAQHEAFLAQVGEGSTLHAELIDWFRTLPPMLDLGGIRAVHAWWKQEHVDLVNERQGQRPLQGDLLDEVFRKGSEAWQAYEGLTKGYELLLPTGASFLDKSDVRRHEVRTQWWREDARTYRDIAVVDEDQRVRIPELALPTHYVATPVRGSPVFIGHYWLAGDLKPRNDKVACLDFSVGRGGPLVGYQWRGEETVEAANFVGVR